MIPHHPLHRALAVAITATLSIGLVAALLTGASTAEQTAAAASEPLAATVGYAAIAADVDRHLAADGSRATSDTDATTTAGGTLDIFTPSADVLADAETIAIAPDEFDGDVPEDDGPRLAPAQAYTRDGTGIWALVVGIDDYPGSNGDLRSAVNDARDFERALDLFDVPLDQRKVLVDRGASRDAIVDGLDWITANAGPDATAVVFYAGHVRKIGRGDESIIGSDGLQLNDDVFAARLEHLRARHTWIVMAACYGGGFDEALESGRILTAAAPANELAYESSKYGRSFLVQFLIREAWLEGRAAGTVQAAFDHAISRLQATHPDQMPVQFDRLGQLRLGADPKPNPPAPAPAPERNPEQQPAPAPEPAPADEPAPSEPPPPSGGAKGQPDDDGSTDCGLTGLIVTSCK